MLRLGQYSSAVEGEVQYTHKGPEGRNWPLLVTIASAGVLLFWAVCSYLLALGQSAVEPEVGQVAAYTSSGKLLHEVRITTPSGPPTVVVGTHPTTGEDLRTSCTTCHATRVPNAAHGLSQELDEFHLGLVFRHGGESLSCLSCHNPSDYDALRAASGKSIAYADVMSLCAQCHGKQSEDYTHGAHGGMLGHWDLSRGGRTRHSCVDCHDPHAPAFPRMLPTFKPFDRGLNLPSAKHASSSTENHE